MSPSSEEPYRFVGCFLIFPAAAVGTFMILEHPGPPGPLGFLEYFGWWALSISIGLLTGKLLKAFFVNPRLRWIALVGAVALPAVFSWLLWGEIHPETPSIVKATVEYTLQGLGLITIAMVIAFAGRSWWQNRLPRDF